MIKRDFILRWTQELAKVVARLLGKNVPLQLEIIHEVYDDLLDLDIRVLSELPLEAIINYLQEERKYNEGQMEFLAEMLYRHANLLQESSHFLIRRRRLQEALLIFESLEQQQDVYSLERHQRMAHIRQKIDEIV